MVTLKFLDQFGPRLKNEAHRKKSERKQLENSETTQERGDRMENEANRKGSEREQLENSVIFLFATLNRI